MRPRSAREVKGVGGDFFDGSCAPHPICNRAVGHTRARNQA